MPLQVGRESSVTAVHEALGKDHKILLVAQRDPECLNPGADDLFTMGSVASSTSVSRATAARTRSSLRPAPRHVLGVAVEDGCLRAEADLVNEPLLEGPEGEALIRTVRARFFSYLQLQPTLPESIGQLVAQAATGPCWPTRWPPTRRFRSPTSSGCWKSSTPSSGCGTAGRPPGERDRAAPDPAPHQRPRPHALSKSQKEYFLKEQLRAIEEELGQSRLRRRGAPPNSARRSSSPACPTRSRRSPSASNRSLSRMLPLSPQAVVINEYLDWLIHMPWQARTEDNLDLRHVARILDEDHYGLEEPKERILEYLAVKRLRPAHARADPVLRRAAGRGQDQPWPGVARRSGEVRPQDAWAASATRPKSAATAAPTSAPCPAGSSSAIRKAGVRNPVFLLDEIDKMGQDFRGDPASALLEVLDPDENHTFSDHYLEVEYDLSEVLFVCHGQRRLGHSAGAAGPPGDDRTVRLHAGREDAHRRGHLLPRELEAHGLAAADLRLPREILQQVIEYYTREAGIRNLRKAVARILRKIATERASADAPAA